MLLFGRVSMRIKYNLTQTEYIYSAGRNDLYPSPHTLCVTKSTRMKSAVRVARMKGKRNALCVFVGKPEGRRQPERSGRGWDDIIKLKL
jgi:hypothetical protein